MSTLEWGAAGLLTVAVLLTAVRLFLGPTTPDRVVAADTLAVVTTPALAWVASALANPIYLDIALVYGALSFVVVVAIARALEGPRS
jgi:multisubunit Na+/H+ antiporter MnhF subunit